MLSPEVPAAVSVVDNPSNTIPIKSLVDASIASAKVENPLVWDKY